MQIAAFLRICVLVSIKISRICTDEVAYMLCDGGLHLNEP
jgi:hypothetical protein